MVTKDLQDFDIEQIANSGQCFRITQIAPETWTIKALGRTLCITKGNEYIFDCSEEEFTSIWHNYFDLSSDYSIYKRIIRSSGDKYLINAINYGYGIRILRQDLWETIVSFIISQQNNIVRIKSIIEQLCHPFDGVFPSPALLKDFCENDFKLLGLGYRAKYVYNMVKAVLNGEIDLNYLKTLSTQDVIKYLQKFNGIGAKVANCIALFSLHKIDAFPIDVWIKRIIDKYYNGKFPIKKYASFAGIVQQYMFFYERCKKYVDTGDALAYHKECRLGL